MTDKKQLDCELKCKATAQFELEVQQDLDQQDKSLASLLETEEGQENETCGNETKGCSQSNS